MDIHPVERKWFREDEQRVMMQVTGAFRHLEIAPNNVLLQGSDEQLLVPPFGGRKSLIQLR